jgi:hypothetical protein
MKTGRAENQWEFFFSMNLKPLRLSKSFLKIIYENLKGSLKWL